MREGRRGRCGCGTGNRTAGQGQAGEGQMEIQDSKWKGREKLDKTLGYVLEYRGFYGWVTGGQAGDGM